MKLKYFSEQTLPRAMGGGKSTLPKINFHHKGMITINLIAAGLLEVRAGDKITIAQDEQEPENFYLFKDEQHGFEMKSQKNGQYLGLFHRGLVDLIREAKELPEGQSIKALIAGQSTTLKGDKTKYWGILIRSIL